MKSCNRLLSKRWMEKDQEIHNSKLTHIWSYIADQITDEKIRHFNLKKQALEEGIYFHLTLFAYSEESRDWMRKSNTIPKDVQDHAS